jgi:hypothetical protein
MVQPTLLFAAGVLPFVALVAWVNNHLYGSPFESGYGPLAPGFAIENGARNLANYPLWWLQSQGFLAFIFLLAAIKRHTPHKREAVVLIGFGVAVFLAYLFYIPFDAWWFLRFLIPVMPLAFLFCADVIEWATSRFQRVTRFAVLSAFTIASAAYAANFSRQVSILQSGDGEQKYVDAGVFIARATPPEAVVLSMQHSGSIRYYSGRLTLRYDSLDPAWLDRAIATLGRLGRPVYLLLDEWEEEPLRARADRSRAYRGGPQWHTTFLRLGRRALVADFTTDSAHLQIPVPRHLAAIRYGRAADRSASVTPSVAAPRPARVSRPSSRSRIAAHAARAGDTGMVTSGWRRRRIPS